MILRNKVIILALTALLVALVFAGRYNLSKPSLPISLTPTASTSHIFGGCKATGCSGQICGDAQETEEVVSDCMWKAEYACYKAARCERQENGQCGWTQDETLVQCLIKNR